MQTPKRQCMDGEGVGGDGLQLDAPWFNVHGIMMKALLELRLTDLVLKEEVDLTRAVAFCLEVLGIGTSSLERQAAASRQLVALCTHRHLRPAVDNMLVLRRLCRIIDLTDSATALGAAVNALFAVADDSAWQTKGGAAAEVVLEACRRCIRTLKDAAAKRRQLSSPGVAASGGGGGGNAPPSAGPPASDPDAPPSLDAAMADGSVVAAAGADPAIQAAGGPSSAEAILDSGRGPTPAGTSSAPKDEKQAMSRTVAAAAAVLQPQALKLLDVTTLVEAAAALAGCLAIVRDDDGDAAGGGVGGGGAAAASVDAAGATSSGGGPGAAGATIVGGAGGRGGVSADATSTLLAGMAAVLVECTARGDPGALSAAAAAVVSARGALTCLIKDIRSGRSLELGGGGGGGGDGGGGGSPGAMDAAAATVAAAAAAATAAATGPAVATAAPTTDAAACEAPAAAAAAPADIVAVAAAPADAPAAAAEAAIADTANAAEAPLMTLHMSPIAKAAFSVLSTTLAGLCRHEDGSKAAVAAAGLLATAPAVDNDAVAALLPLLCQEAADDAAAALRCLLVIAPRHPCARASLAARDGATAPPRSRRCAVADALAEDPESAMRRGVMVRAALRAAAVLAGRREEGPMAAPLMRLAADLMDRGALSADRVPDLAPWLYEAAVGVVVADGPGQTWSAFNGCAQPVGDGGVRGVGVGGAGGSGSASWTKPSWVYPAELRSTAAEITIRLMTLAAEKGYCGGGAAATSVAAAAAAADDGADGEWRRMVDDVVKALVKRLVLQPAATAAATAEATTAAAFCGAAELDCLTLGLQLVAPEGLWPLHGWGGMEKAAQGFTALLGGVAGEPAAVGHARLSLAAMGAVSLWAVAPGAAPAIQADPRPTWRALLVLLTELLDRSCRVAAEATEAAEATGVTGVVVKAEDQPSPPLPPSPPPPPPPATAAPLRGGEAVAAQVRQLAVVAGAVNAVVACLRPGKAVVLSHGHRSPEDQQGLRPALTAAEVPGHGAMTTMYGGLTELYNSWEKSSMWVSVDAGPSKPTATVASNRARIYRYPPSLAMELKWAFEQAPAPVKINDVCKAFYTDDSGSYGIRYDTVACKTVGPLSTALGAAVERLNALVAAVLRNGIGGGIGGGGGGPDDGTAAAAATAAMAEALPLVATALRVAGSAATVVAACVPPGEKGVP